VLSGPHIGARAAGSWLASSRVLLREEPGATWATAHRVAGSCCAGDAEADALVEHGVRADRLVQPPVERIPGYDLF
jgi:hypothetical protein